MSRVEDLGWPEANKLTIGKKERQRRIVTKDDFIDLLKCTPACWRFYFYVRETTRHFVYVHGVCKKKSQGSCDAVTARQRSDKRASGRLSRTRSPLDAAIDDPKLRLARDNDVRFHISRHLLHLRRFRKMSQTTLATKVGTSQSAIARIESGEENATETTVERIITKRDGRFLVSSAPAEYPVWAPTIWWRTRVPHTVWSIRCRK